LGFAIVGLDIRTIGCGTHPTFGSGLTSNIGLFVLNFIKIFSISSGSGLDGILIPHHRKALLVMHYVRFAVLCRADGTSHQ